MFNIRNVNSGKRKYLGGLLLLLLMAIVVMAFSLGDNKAFDISRREVLLRRIGHEILLQSGDRTSRVLPIKQIADNEYQISFEHELSFQPDSLVNITQRLLAKDPLSGDYVVNVINCGNGSVAYGYAISKNKKDDIIACLGREQPTACYRINIQFKPKVITAKHGYLLGSLLFIGLVGFVVFRPVKPEQPLDDQDSQTTEPFTLGSIAFDTEHRTLTMNNNIVDLTKTEARVLRMFALSPNEVIERSRLQKEIWEDEGVIVGRSLDVFISKLRKKLELDPNVNIVVIRGKGYRLEIGG